jgi:hypothetical protein
LLDTVDGELDRAVVVELQDPESGVLIDGGEPMLGAENLSDFLAEGGLPLPGGMQGKGCTICKGTHTDVTQPGECRSSRAPPMLTAWAR